MFGSHFSNSATIVLTAKAQNDPYSGTLASASSYFTNPGSAGFNLGEVVRTKLQTGIDLNGNVADGVVTVNFGADWELDFNTHPLGDGDGIQALTTSTVRYITNLPIPSVLVPVMTQSGDEHIRHERCGSWSTFPALLPTRTTIG